MAGVGNEGDQIFQAAFLPELSLRQAVLRKSSKMNQGVLRYFKAEYREQG
ncbi:hypothetical protein HY29_17285 [Hyphomonas beringensis]|uniref:Uncharacterized protein n=1 Tax=Hyphomonas beringensis TaxID=1280946 RepID=A0A062U4M7_9PROT|nr:hypothetical protein HY29_17285 [Hyphomonas beringensis]